jgi:hypothetical protein
MQRCVLARPLGLADAGPGSCAIMAAHHRAAGNGFDAAARIRVGLAVIYIKGGGNDPILTVVSVTYS